MLSSAFGGCCITPREWLAFHVTTFSCNEYEELKTFKCCIISGNDADSFTHPKYFTNQTNIWISTHEAIHTSSHFGNYLGCSSPPWGQTRRSFTWWVFGRISIITYFRFTGYVLYRCDGHRIRPCQRRCFHEHQKTIAFLIVSIAFKSAWPRVL